MKSLFWGIVLIVTLGVGGLVYRNAAEHPMQPIACPLDARLCPDGTSVGRTGNSCTFPVCPLPNVSLADVGISFAIPDGFVPTEVTDAASIAAYSLSATSTDRPRISIRHYANTASSTPLEIIQQTAISGTSGMPVPVTSFSSSEFGPRRFTVASIERFEGVIDTAYYLARSNDVLRFDAVDTGVTNWTDQNFDSSTLPAHAALIKLLTNLQVQ